VIAQEFEDAPDVIGESSSHGSPVGLPVVAGGSDGGMAMVGAKENTVITVGTSGAIRRVASSPLLDSQARVWCYVQDASHWLAGGAINNGGLAAQRAKEKFYPHDDFETMFEEVEMMAEYTSFGTYPLLTTSSYSCSPPSSKM
jgi:sugar (pentulose or hexulose) kinase